MQTPKLYSDYVERDGWIYLSGKTGAGADGSVPAAFSAQLENAMASIARVLQSAGSSLVDLVKVTVFLTDMSDYPALNAAYASYFGSDLPSRTCVAVAALPRSSKIEIEAIAFRKSKH